MTIEEALKTLKENCCAMCAYGSPDMDSCDISSCDNKDAIKALEQEPILDKIRAEIEPKCDRINSLASVLPYTAHREIQELLCEIMDLCKAESEGKE